MSAPFVGKRVEVIETSRAELNGTKGQALDYDRDKGRYNVRLDTGQTIALKPCNLQPTADQSASAEPSPATKSRAPASKEGSKSGFPAATDGSSWPMMAMMALFAAYIFSQFQGGGGGGGGASLFGSDTEDVEYDDRDEGYISGKIREVGTLDQLRGALAYHSDNTGLPVVVDFYSHSCGPCRMIAPTFSKLAKEYKGRVVFLKVDVNRNYEASSACHVRGMPTFQYYQNRKKVNEFSGADERRLRQQTATVDQKAIDAGTFVGKEVTEEALQAFYTEHDPSKSEEVAALAAKYSQKTAQLVRVCKQKYSGNAPKVSARKKADDASEEPSKKKKSPSAGPRKLTDLSLEELSTEMQRVKEELQRRGGEDSKEEEEEEEVPFAPAENVTGRVEDKYKLVIIGGGPAGLSAATYAARAGFQPLVVAPVFGGQLLGKGVDIENYPGVVGEHATGRGLVGLMRRQAHSFGARFVDSMVLGLNLAERPFQVQLNCSESAASSCKLGAHALILAAGAESRWLEVEGEHEFRGRGVSACATCDGFLYREKAVVVIGGGDTAMEDALHLARNSQKVTLVHRRDSFRASKVLADRVKEHGNIKIRWNTTVVGFHGKEDLTHITIRPQTGQDERLDASGAFVAIGHDPQTSHLRGQLEMSSTGYVVLKPSTGFGTATSVPGVFAAGDVADHVYRQAVTAAGTGAMAALDAEKMLNTETE